MNNPITRKVIALWNQNRGWIPGDAYTELAEALGIDPARLTHFDPRQMRQVEGRPATFADLHVGEGMRSLGVYRLFFKAALAKVKSARAAYDEEVRDWYENGPGQNPDWRTEGDRFGNTWSWNAGGDGHTFPHCIHGVSRWVDYDCACGACEDSLTDLQEARGIAREAWLRFNDRWDWFQSAPGDLQNQQPEAYKALTAWVFASWAEPIGD